MWNMYIANYTIECSCGKQTVCIWDVELQRYVTQDPSWIWHPPSDPDGTDYGWTCGVEGHTVVGEVDA